MRRALVSKELSFVRGEVHLLPLKHEDRFAATSKRRCSTTNSTRVHEQGGEDVLSHPRTRRRCCLTARRLATRLALNQHHLLKATC